MVGCKFSARNRCTLVTEKEILYNGQSEKKDCPLWAIAEAINTVARILDAK